MRHRSTDLHIHVWNYSWNTGFTGLLIQEKLDAARSYSHSSQSRERVQGDPHLHAWYWRKTMGLGEMRFVRATLCLACDDYGL
jgi:hypothetical protein